MQHFLVVACFSKSQESPKTELSEGWNAMYILVRLLLRHDVQMHKTGNLWLRRPTHSVCAFVIKALHQ